MSQRQIPLGDRFDRKPPNSKPLNAVQIIRFFRSFAAENPQWFAQIRERVDHDSGRPRKLDVIVLIGAAIAYGGIKGEIHMRNLAEMLRGLDPNTQREFGLRWVVPQLAEPGAPVIEAVVTDRQIDYLVDAINTAFVDCPHNHPMIEGEFVLAPDKSGEILGAADLLTADERAAFECAPGCPAWLTIERLGNGLLHELHRFFGFPDSESYALDSYLLQTHFARKSTGSKADVDPTWVSDRDRPAAATGEFEPVIADNRARRRSRPTKATQAGLAEIQRELTINASEQARTRRRGHAPSGTNAKSRRIPPVGPTVGGPAMTTFHPDFPQLRPDGRLAHTKDAGAATGYQGTGASRSSSFLNGRDKHTLVSSGHFPDGSPFPPFLRAYACPPGGDDKGGAALRILRDVTRLGLSSRKVAMDRIYTQITAEDFEHPVREIGWDIVKDLRDNQRNYQQIVAGVDLRDGWYFTSGMPAGLHEIERPPQQGNAESRERSAKRFDQRIPYAFRANGTTSTGGLRLRGPAVPDAVIRDETGRVVAVRGVRVRCKNSRYFRLLDRTIPSTQCGKTCGCSKNITIPANEIPNSFEPRIYGTSKWSATYHRRNLVESFNSFEEYHQRVNRHSIRVRARKWDLAHLFLTAGTLLKQIFSFLQRLGAHALDPATYNFYDRDVVKACLARLGVGEGTQSTAAAEDPHTLE